MAQISGSHPLRDGNGSAPRAMIDVVHLGGQRSPKTDDVVHSWRGAMTTIRVDRALVLEVTVMGYHGDRDPPARSEPARRWTFVNGAASRISVPCAIAHATREQLNQTAAATIGASSPAASRVCCGSNVRDDSGPGVSFGAQEHSSATMSVDVGAVRPVAGSEADRQRRQQAGLDHLAQRFSYSFERAHRGRQRRVRKGEHELLATPPRCQVSRTEAFADGTREHPQHPIAGRVAVPVVDRLELVEVTVRDRETCAGSTRVTSPRAPRFTARQGRWPLCF